MHEVEPTNFRRRLSINTVAALVCACVAIVSYEATGIVLESIFGSPEVPTQEHIQDNQYQDIPVYDPFTGAQIT